MNSGQNSLSIILHGGAGAYDAADREKKLPYLQSALDAAWSALIRGEPAETAVVAALRILEGCEYFDAGYGGYPNVNGVVLLDVGVMRGNRDFISIMNLRRVKHPSLVAFDMLQRGRSLATVWTHELMQELDRSTPERKERYGWVATQEEMVAPYVLELAAKRAPAKFDPPGESHGTVGCVARDSLGHLAAGTSTGGTFAKPNGRIGDSPIVGAGVFADDEVGALSTTGHGESILSSALSGFVLAEVRRRLQDDPLVFEKDPGRLFEVLQSEIMEAKRKAPQREAAIIFLPPRGNPSFAFNSEALPVAQRYGSAADVEYEEITIARNMLQTPAKGM